MKSSRLFLFTALVQGLLFWWLSYSYPAGLWPVAGTIRMGIIFMAFAVPLFIYWTHNVDELPVRIRKIAIVISGMVFSFLGGYLIWTMGTAGIKTGLPFAFYLTSFILCFVSVNLLIGFDFNEKRWKYDRLFRYSWRNGTLLLIVIVIAAVFWGVLHAGAALMDLIGVNWVSTLIGKDIFVYPVTCLVVGGTFALGVERSSITDSSTRFAVAVSSWLLVLLLFFSVAWVVAIPFSEWELFSNILYLSLALCWFVMLAVAFASCVYQEGQIKWPYSPRLSLLVQVAWLSLLPLTAVLCWAICLRVEQYGWTQTRIWGALVATMAVIYSVGYALSWFDRSRWMSAIGRTNIFAAIFLCMSLIALLTPIADINRLSVISQANRITNEVAKSAGGVPPDLSFFKNESNYFSQKELKKWEHQNGVSAESATPSNETDARKNLPATNSATEIKITRNSFIVYPKQQNLPDDFLAYAQSNSADNSIKSCVIVQKKCPVWIGKLKMNDPKQQNQIVLLSLKNYSPKAIGYASGMIYAKSENGWQLAGNLRGEINSGVTDEQLNQAKADSSEWQDLVIAGIHYRFYPIYTP